MCLVRSPYPDLLPPKSNQFHLKSKWMFVPSLKKFSQGVPQNYGRMDGKNGQRVGAWVELRRPNEAASHL